jgi:hypothetical protein
MCVAACVKLQSRDEVNIGIGQMKRLLEEFAYIIGRSDIIMR